MKRKIMCQDVWHPHPPPLTYEYLIFKPLIYITNMFLHLSNPVDIKGDPDLHSETVGETPYYGTVFPSACEMREYL